METERLAELASDGFGHWLAGFVDGEGSFLIVPNRPGFICRLCLSLREDDRPILDEIQRRTGLGKTVLRKLSPSGRRRAQAMWRVQKKAECLVVVSIFDHFPLRAKKARDFAVWREAVLTMASMPPAISKGRYGVRPLDWDRVASLKEQLAQARNYGLVSLLDREVETRTADGVGA